jgi:hypothetical protein
MAGLLKNELARMWKEVIVAYLKVLSRDLPGITYGNWERRQHNQYCGRDSNRTSPEYKSKTNSLPILLLLLPSTPLPQLLLLLLLLLLQCHHQDYYHYYYY